MSQMQQKLCDIEVNQQRGSINDGGNQRRSHHRRIQLQLLGNQGQRAALRFGLGGHIADQLLVGRQSLPTGALQAALRLGDQIGQAYRLCDASAWDADELAVTWGNGVLYDADQEWTERKELVQMGLLKPELALAWKFDLPAESEADLAEIRKNYMPELKDLEG